MVRLSRSRVTLAPRIFDISPRDLVLNRLRRVSLNQRSSELLLADAAISSTYTSSLIVLVGCVNKHGSARLWTNPHALSSLMNNRFQSLAACFKPYKLRNTCHTIPFLTPRPFAGFK